jgi:hypothetical protein
MNENEQRKIERLLKQTMQLPQDVPLRSDLWPEMLQRLQVRPARVPWFDWALLAILAVWLIFFPGAIPVLLYHL